MDISYTRNHSVVDDWKTLSMASSANKLFPLHSNSTFQIHTPPGPYRSILFSYREASEATFGAWTGLKRRPSNREWFSLHKEDYRPMEEVQRWVVSPRESTHREKDSGGSKLLWWQMQSEVLTRRDLTTTDITGFNCVYKQKYKRNLLNMYSTLKLSCKWSRITEETAFCTGFRISSD